MKCAGLLRPQLEGSADRRPVRCVDDGAFNARDAIHLEEDRTAVRRHLSHDGAEHDARQRLCGGTRVEELLELRRRGRERRLRGRTEKPIVVPPQREEGCLERRAHQRARRTVRCEVDVGRERYARHVREISGRARLHGPSRTAAAVAELRLRRSEQCLRRERARALLLRRGVTVAIAPALLRAVRGEPPLGAARVLELDAYAALLRRADADAALPPRRLVLVLRP